MGDPATTFATYNAAGLNAVLDYHTPDAPGRAAMEGVLRVHLVASVLTVA